MIADKGIHGNRTITDTLNQNADQPVYGISLTDAGALTAGIQEVDLCRGQLPRPGASGFRAGVEATPARHTPAPESIAAAAPFRV